MQVDSLDTRHHQPPPSPAAELRLVLYLTTFEGKRYSIFMRNQTLVVDKETETLLSVAVLLKAGFEVKFVTGTKKDPTFGGYLVTPDGQKIRMIFGYNPWRLPV